MGGPNRLGNGTGTEFRCGARANTLAVRFGAPGGEFLMRRLSVDFAQASRWPQRLVTFAAILLFPLAIWNAGTAWKLHDSNTALEAEQSQLRSVSAEPAPPPSSPEPAYLRDALAVQTAAGFDTAGVLRAVESVKLAGVRVTSIEISAIDQRASIEIEVSESGAVLQYLEQLNAGYTAELPPWKIRKTTGPSGNLAGSAVLEYRSDR